MRRSRGIRLLLAVIGAAAALAAGVARAQDYDLEFTLPTAGKSGCMVCHGDRNLIRPMGTGFVSYYVDGAVLDGSAHAKVMCTGCHTDFAFKAPHVAGPVDWRVNAKLACKNCHQSQFSAYSAGAHSISAKPGTPEAEQARAETLASRAATSSRGATGSAAATASAGATRSVPASVGPSVITTMDIEGKPLCGDCHGAHDIDVLKDNPAGQLRLHRKGYEVCGRCHKEWWDSYADYYHGSAFKAGVADAPACWDCHSWHDIRPSSDRKSGVSDSNLVETCAKCHKRATQDFVDASRDLIHGRGKARDENPVRSALVGVWDAVSGFIGGLFD